MVFPFYSLQDDNPEIVSLDREPTENDFLELSKKINDQVRRGPLKVENDNNIPTQRKSYEAFNSDLGDNFNQLKNEVYDNLQCPIPGLGIPSLIPNQSFNLEDYMNQDHIFPLETMEHLSHREQSFILRVLLELISLPRELILDIIRFSKIDRKGLIRYLKISLIATGFYLSMLFAFNIFIPYLMKLSKSFKKEILRIRAKRKKKLNGDEKNPSEELNGFRDKTLNLVGGAINTLRGGYAVPIQKLKRYTLLKFKDEKLLAKFQRTTSKQKSRFLKVKIKIVSDKCKPIFFGIFLLMSVPNVGVPISTLNRNLPNTEIVVLSPRFSTSVLPVSGPVIKEVDINEQQKIESTPSFRKEVLKTPSGSRVVNGARKKAKLVRLSDLPPLPEQDSDSDLETYLPTIPRSMGIKVR